MKDKEPKKPLVATVRLKIREKKRDRERDRKGRRVWDYSR